MKISAVIPTRNRSSNLKNVLNSLLTQTRPVDEILLIDSSDRKDSIDLLKKEYASLPIIWIDTTASVCLQRNIGIQAASGDWIFLCDDDIELNEDYLEKLETYTKENVTCGALAGRLLQYEGNDWTDQYPVKDFKELIWKFIFQLSIWGDINLVKTSAFVRPLYFLIKKFYTRRGNGFTLAGWPLITNWNGDSFQTSVYSLGANLIKKEWLLHSPYDEALDPNGIGDNYGVALGFPGRNPIHVLSSTFAYHHRAKENRLDATLIYYRRILALHYFIKQNKKFPSFTAAAFIWSLFGNAVLFFLKGNNKMYKITFKAMMVIMRTKNPYWIGFVKNEKIVQPYY